MVKPVKTRKRDKTTPPLPAFPTSLTLAALAAFHRRYAADVGFTSLVSMVQTKYFTSQVLIQIVFGTLVPIGFLAMPQLLKLSEQARKGIYLLAGSLTLIGIFAMRWNVVIGGQLFSKSFLGYTTYKMGFATREGLLPAIILLVLPFVILRVLVKLLPPWHDESAGA